MPQKIQIRRGTAAAWTTANPVLFAGELGLEQDTHKLKSGDGSTAWASLPYLGASAIADISGLQSALDAKAAIASPTFTGTPSAPTAGDGTNTTQIATTAFVHSAVSGLGGSAISTPHVIYLETTGNDSTGQIGNPAKPFRTGTAAAAAGEATSDSYNLAVGFGAFTITGVSVNNLSGVVGADRARSQLTITLLDGAAGQGFIAPTTAPTNGGDANGMVIRAANITLYLHGGNGGAGGSDADDTDNVVGNSGNGGNGSDIYLFGHGVDIGYVQMGAGGDAGATSPDGLHGGNGGRAGNLTLVGGITCGGISPTNGGAGAGNGAGGETNSIYLSGITAGGYAFGNQGSPGPTGSNPSAANVIQLDRCQYTSISAPTGILKDICADGYPAASNIFSGVGVSGGGALTTNSITPF